jgi:hypothetical protein
MANLMQFLSLLIIHDNSQFADVAQELLNKEREKKEETVSTLRNDVLTGTKTSRNRRKPVGKK